MYHLDQVPASTAIWESLATAVVTQEIAGLTTDTQIERTTGHIPGTPPVLVWEFDWVPPGEGGLAGQWVPSAGDVQTPGDTAGWVRYGTTQKNKLGKPIYLRNYYHGVYWGLNRDEWSPSQKGHFDTLGQMFVTGFNVQGTIFRRAGPRGAVAQNHASSTWLTTRTLKRRGKRKKVAVNPADARDTPVLIPGWLGGILDDAIP